MLLRIDERFVIKTDRYCFMICVDKGIQKFPGGIERQYYEPSKFCGSLNATIDCKSTHDGGHHDLISVFEGHDLPEEYTKACQLEKDLRNFLDSNKFIDSKYELFGCKIKPSRGHYVLSIPGRDIYPSTLGNAIFSCYSSNLREDSKFGVASGEGMAEGNWSEVIKAIEKTKAFAEKIIDKNEDSDKK